MKKIYINNAVILASMLSLIGCANMGGGNKVVSENGADIAFVEYKKDRPSADYYPTDIKSVDTIAQGIAGLYRETVKLSDSYIDSAENNSVALKLENVRKNQGEDVYIKEVNALTGVDKEEYQAYLNAQLNKLKSVKGYLSEATRLSIGIKNIDNVSNLSSNPFAMAKIVSSVSVATKQANYSMKSLKFLKETMDVMQAVKSHTGR